MVGNGVGAKNGILYKTAASLEGLGRTKIIALDKTGTITKGEPEVTDIIPAEASAVSGNTNDLLCLAASLESKSEHPLGKAVCTYATAKGIVLKEALDFQSLPGKGLSALIDGRRIYGGNSGYILDVPGEAGKTEGDAEKLAGYVEKLSKEGKTPLIFADERELLGIIAVADTIKEDSAQAIAEMREMGLKVIMLTGDNKNTAEAIGTKAGVDEVVAGVLPDGKEEVVRKLSGEGRTAMVGDGINDAPALVRADSGIAIGAGTDVAIDAADIVLVKSRLTDAAAAVRLSRATIRNIHQNLFWAFFYNLIGIPLAMGLYGFEMKPVYGAAAMSLSSFFVCMNALRLNLVKLYGKKGTPHPAPDGATLPSRGGQEQTGNIIKDTCGISKKEDDGKMTKTLKVEGMMCEHCEARVKKALEAIDGVESAVASHKDGTAVVTLSKDVDTAVLAAAVEAQDYKVTG